MTKSVMIGSPSLPGMELRHLRYFVAVAEELHFARAARRLHMSAPPLSQRIKELERRLGVELFTRTPRSVALTPAGERLLERARAIVVAADALPVALAEPRPTPPGRHSVGRLSVGLLAHGMAELNTPIVRAFRAAHPRTELHMCGVAYGDEVEALSSGRIDVLLALGPVHDDRLEFHHLAREPRVAVLSRQDPLADAPAVAVQDIVHRPYLRTSDTGAGTPWSDYWMLGDIRPVSDAQFVGIPARSVTEAHARIALGEGIGTAPASTARFSPHPDLAFVPVVDAPHSPLGIAVRRAPDEPLTDAFVHTAGVAARRLAPALLDGSDHLRSV